LTCQAAAERALVERYLAGTLPEADAAEFESHYLTCADCQEALKLGAALRRTLPRAEETVSGRRWILIGLPSLAAAAVAGLLLFGDRPDPALRALGGVSPAPVYLGVPIRLGEASVADSLFEAAMAAYGTERYAESVTGLRAALEAGVDRAPAEFFLGAGLLMVGNPAEAAEALSRVVALGETPYLAEARFYRAKALLQLGRGSEALEELRQVPTNTIVGDHARALTDSIMEVRRR
jgi:tetratricopeptide (TPR) repeat protein